VSTRAMAKAKRKREGGGAKDAKEGGMEVEENTTTTTTMEEEDEVLNRRIDKLLSLCERAAQARLHQASESSETKGEVLAQRIYAFLYDAIPRCAAFAYKKSTGAKHPMCFLKEVMTAEEFASKDTHEEGKSGKQTQALGTCAWQAVSAYAVCLDETLREAMVARPQSKEKDGEGNGGEAEAAGTREEEARAMLGAFREDAERALEGEVGGENGRAELLMMGLMQGYDALSQLEKEAVLDAERRSR